LDAAYVQKVVDALNNHVPIFNAAKIFNACHYPSDDSD
jgi:hypothetical protein